MLRVIHVGVGVCFTAVTRVILGCVCVIHISKLGCLNT